MMNKNNKIDYYYIWTIKLAEDPIEYGMLGLHYSFVTLKLMIKN